MLQPLQTSANDSTLVLPIYSFLLPNKTLLASLDAHFGLHHSVSLEPFGEDDAEGHSRTLLYVLRLNGIDFGGWHFEEGKTVVLQPMALTEFILDGDGEVSTTVLLGTCIHDPDAPATPLIKYESVPLAALGLFGPLPDGEEEDANE
jgi:hypothetical protein